MIKKIFFIGLLFAGISLSAQTINFKTVEQTSYAYYMSGQWDSVITIGKIAEKSGIDYYYLNYRMGIAYYNRKNFFMASHYLEKALQQNAGAHSDELFNRTLYLSYIYTLRNRKALSVPLSFAQRPNPLALSKLYIYGGGGSSVPFDLSDIQRPGGPGHNPGQTPSSELAYLHYQQGQGAGGFSIDHIFGPKLSMDFSFSAFRFDDVASFENDDSLTINTFPIYQQSFALIPEYGFNNKWSLRLAIGFTHNSGEPYVLYDTSLYYLRTYGKYKVNINNILAGGVLYYHLAKSKIGLEIGFSNYSKRTQYQAGLNYLIFPFGNMNFYSLSSLSAKYENSETKVVFYQKFGFKTFSRLWVELSGRFGELKNFNVFSEGYGYNTTDHINTIIKAKFIFLASAQLDLFVEGNFYKRHGLRYEVYQNNDERISKVNYEYWTVLGGLVWSFNNGTHKNKIK
jgi:hypothetical protein